jgi:hypothetical protein
VARVSLLNSSGRSLSDYTSILAAGVSVPIVAFVFGIAMLWAFEGFKLPKKSN